MSDPPHHRLNRARRSVARHLANGWERAVFATPQGASPHRERVVDGPGAGSADGDIVREVWSQAVAAAEDGLHKLTFVLDPLRRVLVDARHGFVRLQVKDETSLLKAMGGKARLFRPDSDADFLRTIGIMNADGSVSARRAKKYKQVHHLAELCRPAWEAVTGQREISEQEPLRVLDVACGNSYLSFVIAAALAKLDIPVRVVGIDMRPDVIQRSRERAEALGWNHMVFHNGTIDDARAVVESELGGVDVLVSLHACDTATDEALALGVGIGAVAILCVPCCQAELAAQLENNENAPLSALVGHGLLRRHYGSVLTDALRIEALQSCGYSVSAVEFVDVGHTPKNLLIRANRSRRRRTTPKDWRLDDLERRCSAMQLRPRLLTLLRGLGVPDGDRDGPG